MPAVDTPPLRTKARSWVWIATSVVVLSTVICGWVGASQAVRYERVFASLDPIFSLLRDYGELLSRTAFQSRWLLAQSLSAGLMALGLVSLGIARGRGMPVVVAGMALAAATWGEVFLQSDQYLPGIGLLAGGMIASFALGLWQPLRTWMHPGADSPTQSSSLSRNEIVGLTVLTLVALSIRVYALNELPRAFEGEMLITMYASRTWQGLKYYVPYGLTANSNGFLHLIAQWISYSLFGSSLFSLRFVSAVGGVAMVPAFYCLLRRIGGISSATFGTVLLVFGAEQLFWSRSESTVFVLLMLLITLTAQLSLSLVRTPDFRRAVLAAVWLPFTRYFYSPCIVLPFFLLATYGHSLLFTRGAWRKGLVVVPVLLVGMVLWVFSLSAPDRFFGNSQWRFINPAVSVGAPVWQGEANKLASPTVAELLQRHADNAVKNLASVATALTSQAGFTQWYFRVDRSTHPTWINVCLSVLLLVGIAYLLGQAHDPKAFLLLAWFAIGLLPGILSLDPAPRRLVLIFPVIYAIAGVALGALFEMVRRLAAPWLTRLTGLALTSAVAAIACTSLASFLLVQQGQTIVDRMRGPTREIFTQSDSVYYGFDPNWEFLMSLVHGDELFTKPTVPCMTDVGPQEWLVTALQIPCDYDDPPFQYAFAPVEREQLRARYDPQKISFVLPDIRPNRPHLDLLGELFPQATLTRLEFGDPQMVDWLALGVERSTIEEMKKPHLRIREHRSDKSELATHLLAGVALQVDESSDAVETRVDGGLLIDTDGWYSFSLDPACSESTLSIDERRADSSTVLPVTKGVHTTSLALPETTSCATPLRVLARRYTETGMQPVSPPMWVAPRLVDLSHARARRVVLDAGFEEQAVSIRLPGTTLDFDLDASGTLSVLQMDVDDLRLHRVDLDGNVQTSWSIESRPEGISVAPDGTTFLYSENRVVVYDRAGNLVDTWKGALVRTYALGHLANGDLLSPVSDHDSVAILDRQGKTKSEWTRFEGGPGSFKAPVSAQVDAQGNLFIFQMDGTGFHFRTPLDRFEPVFVSTFRVELRDSYVQPRGWTLAGKRLIVPERGYRNTLQYELDGSRIMSESPLLDLNTVAGQELKRVVSTERGLYVLDGRLRIRRFVSRTTHAET